MKIQVIIGSTRPNRFGEQPAQWIYKKLKERKEVEAELLDLRDYPMPLFNEPMSPAQPNFTYTDKIAEKWAKKINEADGYIWIAAEYNHGYTAVLKNAIDYVYKEWNKKAVGFVGYGSVGGARSVEQLRQVAAEVQMVSVRTAVLIPEYWNLLDENGKLKTEHFEYPAKTMIDQLIWWSKALKDAREKDNS